MIEVNFYKSKKPDKRIAAVYTKKGNIVRTVHFGSGEITGKGTNVDHKDDKIKKAWIARHKVRGDFSNPYTPSALAYWILWNKKSIKSSIADYKRHFGFS